MPLTENIARGGYSADEILAALTADDVQLDFRFELLNSSGAVVRELTTVEAASVSQDAERDIPRTARFSIQESLGFTERFEFDRSSEWLQYGTMAAAWDWQTSDAMLSASGGVQSVLIRDEQSYQNVELDLTTTHAHDGGVVARFRDSNNYYSVCVSDDSGASPTGNIRLCVKVGGSTTTIQTADVTFIRDTEHAVKWRIEGTRHRVWFDGVLLMDTTNSALTASGGVGMRANGNTQIYNRFSCTSLDTINYLTQSIKPYVRLLMDADDGVWIDFPLGVFLPLTVTPATDENGIVSYDIEGYDQTQKLIDSTIDSRYFISAGATITTEVVALLQAAGISDYTVTASTLTLPQSRDYEPGVSRFDILKELLASINYRYGFDGDGKFYAEGWSDPATRAAVYTYRTDRVSVINPKAARSLDLYGVPNRVTLIMSEPDRETPLYSTAINHNPDSPTSYVSRGRYITTVIQNVQAPDQPTLDALAARTLYELSQVEESVSLETAIMPFHGHADTVYVEIDPLRVNSLYELVSWELALSVEASMRLRVRRIIQVL